MTCIAAGVTLFEAFKAADKLETEGINLRIIDPFTIKPIDVDLISKSVEYTHGRVITVEDHGPEGKYVLSNFNCSPQHSALLAFRIQSALFCAETRFQVDVLKLEYCQI